ncbi:MAG TPA: hypothetical protein VGL58_19245 [Caulobacteraceae bacterium]|jgi:hypothetical protein
MARIDIGRAMGSGLALVRREPRAALCWGLIVGAGFGLLAAAQATMLTTMIGPMFDARAMPPSGQQVAGMAASPSGFIKTALGSDAVLVVLAFVFGGVGAAFFSAPWASAYRDLVAADAAMT